MKVQLRAGQEFDLTTPDELRAILGELFPARRGPQTDRPVESVKLDGTGAGKLTLFTVPAGMMFTLHRLMIDADGKTPGSRISTGYAYLQQGNVPIDVFDFTLTGLGIPVVFSWTGDAPVYHEREAVCVNFTGVSASAVIVCRGQGTLAPMTIG